MAIYKCKMCGGTLEIDSGVTVTECEYCGTRQTIPSVMEENLQGLFNRANTLRLKNEFDKAEQVYEKILQTDDQQAEAYWGLILCKYGIEYVEDPKTHKRIPTCHRASFDSVIADDDYKSALNYSDTLQRNIYEAEANEIDRLQKEILALSRKEESYDVFLCYKETDESGERTHDSVIANDIYYQLTQEGLKVFYAAITLEGKLGTAYEPVIFAALNSAKVMLVIGTKPEYFNAVWVKNEWSRFLKIIKKDRSKLLIPCYKDMDAYDLPEEFSHLQAQDMSKIGFINDIVRGIKKVTVKETPKTATAQAAPSAPASSSVSPLLRRAQIFLENHDWANADAYCEKVLDLEPENATAYIYKLMAARHCAEESDLSNGMVRLQGETAYSTALRFADDLTVERLVAYDSCIRERIEQEEDQRRIQREKAAQEKAEREEQLKTRREEEARQRLQREEAQRKQSQLTQDERAATEVAKNIQDLRKKRSKAIVWTVIWAVIFWPVAIYFGIKVLKLSGEITTMEQTARLGPTWVAPQQNTAPSNEDTQLGKRTGMKISMIVCLALAGIYFIMALSDPTMWSAALFFFPIGMMFSYLRRTPKKSQFIYFGKKPSNMKKGTFVFLSIVLSIVLCTIVA